MDERGVFGYFWLGGIPLLPKVTRCKRVFTKKLGS
jgi:hypothetical protein